MAEESAWEPLWRALRRWSMVMLPLAFFLVFFVGPLLYLFVVSLLEPSQTDLYGTRPTFENYVKVVGDEFYLRIIKRTLLTGALVTGAALLIGYPVALAIARMPPRWRLLAMGTRLFFCLARNARSGSRS